MEAYQLAEGGYKDGFWFQRWISVQQVTPRHLASQLSSQSDGVLGSGIL